jgi:hypothetical protein
MISDKQLQAIEARVNAATPHERITYCRYEHGGGRAFVDGESGDRHLVLDTYSEADREFDFASRLDVQTLLKDARQLREMLAVALSPEED